MKGFRLLSMLSATTLAASPQTRTSGALVLHAVIGTATPSLASKTRLGGYNLMIVSSSPKVSRRGFFSVLLVFRPQPECYSRWHHGSYACSWKGCSVFCPFYSRFAPPLPSPRDGGFLLLFLAIDHVSRALNARRRFLSDSMPAPLSLAANASSCQDTHSRRKREAE